MISLHLEIYDSNLYVHILWNSQMFLPFLLENIFIEKKKREKKNSGKMRKTEKTTDQHFCPELIENYLWEHKGQFTFALLILSIKSWKRVDLHFVYS